MLLTVTTLENPGPPSPVPPPIAPKPRKDNARLQRLLRKAAKRSNVQASPTQPHKSFRSTLSPVSEAVLENMEPAVSQKQQPLSINLPPRFQIRGATQRVPSPYPKQRSFTFTVVEQHSLNQYLSTSPIPDTPSPRPLPSSPLNTPFLYPPGHSTPDVTSLEVNSNNTPQPCKPQSITIMLKPPTEPHLNISDPPIIIIHETDQNSSGLISTNTDIKVDPIVLNTESGTCSTKDEDVNLPKVPDGLASAPKTPKSPLFAQQDPTYTSSNCSPLGIAINSTERLSTSLTPLCNDITGTEFSKDEKVSCITTHSSGSSKTIIEVKTTNSADGKSEVTTKSVSAEVTISPNITKSNHAKSTSCTDGSTTSGKVSNSKETNLLKTPDRPKPPRKKPGGGWARLVKHLTVDPEEPKFPEPQSTVEREEKTGSDAGTTTEGTQQSKGIRANRMWDALLYHMATSTKVQEKPGASGTAPPPLPFLRSRLPLLLHRPRFDARKLKEAASRPLRRVTTFFHRRLTEKAPSSFNRVASGWSLKGEDDEQKKGEGGKIIEDEVKE